MTKKVKVGDQFVIYWKGIKFWVRVRAVQRGDYVLVSGCDQYNNHQIESSVHVSELHPVD